VAVTVNVYDTPLVKPDTVIGDEAPVPVKPPGLDVTVYPVIALLPVFEGAVKATDAEVLPPVAVGLVGGPGSNAQVVAALACICCLDVQIPE
jgi:hypothetical protein